MRKNYAFSAHSDMQASALVADQLHPAPPRALAAPPLAVLPAVVSVCGLNLTLTPKPRHPPDPDTLLTLTPS